MSIANKTINSVLFILFIRGFHRSLGLVSFVILARLLTPEDFGIVALASTLVFLCDVISASGANQYLVQKSEIDDSDINTAWTLGLILKSVLALVLVFSAASIARFFETPNLTYPLQAIAFILPISALASPAIFLLKRELNYKPIVKIEIYQKVISFFISISLAFYLKNYWAMIFGVIASYAFQVIFSYVFCPRRPQPTLINLTKQWSFSKWIMLKAIIGYMKSEVDTIFVSKLFDISTLGGFNMMKNLSAIPSREIIQPIAEPLLAAFSKLKHDSNAFNFQVLTSCTILLTFTLPCTIIIMLYDHLIVTVFLGEQWLQYSSLLGLLAIFIINFSIAAVFQQALISKAKVKFIFYYDLVTFLLIVTILFFLFKGDIEEFTLVRVWFAVCSLCALVLLSWRILKFSLISFFSLITPLIVATFIASQTIFLPVMFSVSAVELLSRMLLFCLAYIVCLAIIYPIISFASKDNQEYIRWTLNLLKNQTERLTFLKVKK